MLSCSVLILNTSFFLNGCVTNSVALQERIQKASKEDGQLTQKKAQPKSMLAPKDDQPTVSALDTIMAAFELKGLNEQDINNQISKLIQLSKTDPEAMLFLATIYEEGKYISKDLFTARKYYRKAAQSGSELGRYYYALMLIEARGGARDHQSAESLLIKNHQNQHKDSTFALAYLYSLQQNADKTIQYLQKEDLSEHPHAKYLLGAAYLQKNTNIKKAVQLLNEAAEAEIAAAYHIIGKIYYRGLHQEKKDPEKSYRYLNKAAKNKNHHALYDLAMLTLQYPELINNQTETSIKKLKEADEQGNKYASFEIARIYDQGEIVIKNYEKAHYWYKKSAELGNNRAMYNLASMYMNGDGVDVSLEDARFWLEKSAAHGNERAIAILNAE